MRAGRSGAGGTTARGHLLLALETATRATSVALARGDELLADLCTRDAQVHAERLLPTIDQVLSAAGVGLAEVEAFALSIGPGSFTGLRVGLATVKAFALSGGRPVVAVATLPALAAGAVAAPGPVAALLDARRGQLYAAAVSRPGLPEADLLPESVYEPAELLEALPAGCTVVVGEGAAFAADALAAREDLHLVGGAAAEARAERIAQLGARLLAQGETADVDALVPRYLRRAEAEARRLGAALEAEPGRSGPRGAGRRL